MLIANRNFKDEDELWQFVFPNLRGWWRRLEAIQPDGLTDWLGLWNNQTWWCEAKIGKPGLKSLRPSQRDFGRECIKRGVPIWTCFGYRRAPVFCLNFDFERPITPPFLRLPD